MSPNLLPTASLLQSNMLYIHTLSHRTEARTPKGARENQANKRSYHINRSSRGETRQDKTKEVMASFEASGEAGGTGLSKHIRALGISETYDLAGFGEAQVKTAVEGRRRACSFVSFRPPSTQAAVDSEKGTRTDPLFL